MQLHCKVSDLSIVSSIPACCCAGIPIGQTSVFLVAFISFFLLAALFNGNYGESAIDDDATY